MFTGLGGIPGFWEDQCRLGFEYGGLFEVDEFNLLTYYYNLYLTRFKYDNVPESIKSTMFDLSNIDRWLWFAPAVCFFEDEVLGLQCLPCTNEANFNLAFFPKSWSVYGGNGYIKRGLNYNNSALLFNDNARVAPIFYVYKYVKKIVELERISDANIDFQKNPLIMEIDEEQEKSAKKLFSERSLFKRLLLTRKKQKGGILEGLKVNQLKTEFETGKYQSVIDKYDNKILTYIGYNSVQIEKAERLITSEADSNNEKTRAQYTSALENREKCFKRVKELFGKDIKVNPQELVDFESDDAPDVTRGGNLGNGGQDRVDTING